MNALNKCRDAKSKSAAQRRAAAETKSAQDAADHCDALERYADDGGSWICPPQALEPKYDDKTVSAPSSLMGDLTRP